MRFLNNRADLAPSSSFASVLRGRGLGALFVATVLALPLTQTGCPKPPPPKVEPPPAPGDLLRLQGKAQDKLGGTIKVRIEDSDPGSKKKPKAVGFQLEEEHTVEAVDQAGAMHVTAKFFNVESQGESGKEKKAGEELARVLSEAQIAYDVTTRGDVTNFEVKNVPDKYLSQARLIAAWVYGAERGPLFDPGPIEVAKGWPIRATIPIPSGGSKNWEINCTYEKKEKNLATVTLAGKVTGESKGTQLSGEVKGEIRLDIPSGHLTYQDMDSVSTFRPADDPNGGHQVHIHITWEGQSSAPPAPPAGDGSQTQVMP